MNQPPSTLSRRIVLTMGGVSLAALAANQGSVAWADGAEHPTPNTGGIPPGPSTFGLNPQELLDLDLTSDPWFEHLRCTVPRQERIEPFAGTQAHPDLDPEVLLSTLTIDDKGALYHSRNQAIGLEEQVYTQRYWQYIDIWGTWHGQLLPSVPQSAAIGGPGAGPRPHGVIDIPHVGWVEAAHKNGALAIGGWFWPRIGVNFDDFLVQNEDGSFPIADKLIEIRQYFGFDGLFINQEDSITKTQVERLLEFFRYIKAEDPDFYLQWYDAVLPDSGRLSYQNELNSENLPVLGTPEERIIDSIFVNYAWPYVDPQLEASKKAAEDAGFDPRQVGFAGVEHQKGGLRPEECFGDVAAPGKPAPLSVALFVDSEFWSAADSPVSHWTPEGRAFLRDIEQKLWSGPTGNPSTSGRLEPRSGNFRTDTYNAEQWDGYAHSITERSPYGSLPISNTFNIGVGPGYWEEGVQISSTGWDNMGCADRSLSWSYWTEGDLAATLAEGQAWEGAHSVALSGDGVIHLFKTDIRATDDVLVTVVADGLTSLEVGITSHRRPDRVTWHALRAKKRNGNGKGKGAGKKPSDGWTEWATTLDIPRTARISLRTVGTGHLGKIAVEGPEDRRVTPGKVHGFEVETIEDPNHPTEPGFAHVTFRWTEATGAWHYDIYQVSGGDRVWLGRVHRTVFFREDLDLDDGTTFLVIPKTENGNEGKGRRAHL